MKLHFEIPSLQRKQDALEYLLAFRRAKSEIHGSGGLDRGDYESWLQKVRDYHNGILYSQDHVPASTYFVIDEQNKLVGMVNIRHTLNQRLIQDGSGHVGYSVRPCERKKGYATQILKQAIKILRDDYHVHNIEVGCYESNIASRRTIEKNGGILKETIMYDGKPSLVFVIHK